MGRWMARIARRLAGGVRRAFLGSGLFLVYVVLKPLLLDRAEGWANAQIDNVTGPVISRAFAVLLVNTDLWVPAIFIAFVVVIFWRASRPTSTLATRSTSSDHITGNTFEGDLSGTKTAIVSIPGRGRIENNTVRFGRVRGFDQVERVEGLEEGGSYRGNALTVDDVDSRSAPVARQLDTPDGRKKFCDLLVIYHAQGVQLQTGAGSQWQTDQEMADWLTRDGQWLGEILGVLRAFDCSHAEIHDIGVLTPARFITFAKPASDGRPFRENRDRYQSFVTERLHRLKELMKKYEC